MHDLLYVALECQVPNLVSPLSLCCKGTVGSHKPSLYKVSSKSVSLFNSPYLLLSYP